MTDQTQGQDESGVVDAGNEGMPSAAEIMAFDPFGPAEDSDSTAGATDATNSAEDTSKGSTKTAEPKVNLGETPPKDAVDPAAAAAVPATTQAQSTAELERLIREQTAAITATVSRGADPVQEEPPAKYNLGIPPQVINLLRSEDDGEFGKGMHAVINGIANKIWSDVTMHLEETLTRRVPEMFESRQTAISNQERVAQDFYGAHANLADPALRPLIQSVGLKVAQDRVAAGKSIDWSAELRDEIAEAVYKTIPALRPKAAATSKTPATPVRRAPFAAGSNSRPSSAPDPTAEFTELLI